MIDGIISQQSSKSPAMQHSDLIPVYAVFTIVAMAVYHGIAENEFSAMLTLSAIFQCAALCLLPVHVLSTGSVQGISAKSLQLQAVALVCRLSTTTWLEGYLPNDKTGNFLYQSIDMVSLVVVLWLLHRLLFFKCKTYECHHDTLPVTPFAVVSLVLAALLHADLDDNPTFDTLWMCGLFVGALSMLPQLWLVTRTSASAPAVMSHFVAMMAFSCILSLHYMWQAHAEITSAPWIEKFVHAGNSILAAHAVHLVILGVCFVYFCVKNATTQGLCTLLALREPSPLLEV